MPTDVLEDSLVTKDQLSSAVKYNVTDNSNTSKTGLITEIYVSIAS